MSKLTCMVLEDQRPAQNVLKGYLEQVDELKVIGIYGSPTDALSTIKKEKPEVLFLDLHLPKIFGMEFIKIIDPKTKIIITTAYPDYAVESYEWNVVDYLLKPFSFERFLKAVSRLLGEEQPKEVDEQFLFVKLDKEIHKIVFERIIHVEAAKDFVYVQTDEKKMLLSNNLKHWESLLPKNDFFRVHKSFMINLKKIDKIIGNLVYTSKGQIPIGRHYREAFFRRIGQS